jgi:hypothetical protein
LRISGTSRIISTKIIKVIDYSGHLLFIFQSSN